MAQKEVSEYMFIYPETNKNFFVGCIFTDWLLHGHPHYHYVISPGKHLVGNSSNDSVFLDAFE